MQPRKIIYSVVREDYDHKFLLIESHYSFEEADNRAVAMQQEFKDRRIEGCLFYVQSQYLYAST